MVFASFAPKTKSCDFAIRYKLKPKKTFAESIRTRKETNQTTTVEYHNIKKLIVSIPHTIKNKITIINWILSQSGCSEPKQPLFSEIEITTFKIIPNLFLIFIFYIILWPA